jgi:L,D-peptidoglycan transpeptidase YkuD (ErfK/YbiS/YcfS/YnhG family)|tara:strand:+ start:1104 stop:1595 length:492 start_codon:yes stop_codon:yes gene_type:complete
MLIKLKNKDTLTYDDFSFKCSIGKGGITSKKIEGDKKTPRGFFSLGPLFYRKDRNKKPLTKIKTIIINKKMGWCDDVRHKKYNKLIKIGKNIKHEKMFRKDKKYDLLIPINFNTFKPKKNKGSAIFIHLTENYKKTLGCITLKKKDFLILLKLINKKTKIKIF